MKNVKSKNNWKSINTLISLVFIFIIIFSILYFLNVSDNFLTGKVSAGDECTTQKEKTCDGEDVLMCINKKWVNIGSVPGECEEEEDDGWSNLPDEDCFSDDDCGDGEICDDETGDCVEKNSNTSIIIIAVIILILILTGLLAYYFLVFRKNKLKPHSMQTKSQFFSSMSSRLPFVNHPQTKQRPIMFGGKPVQRFNPPKR